MCTHDLPSIYSLNTQNHDIYIKKNKLQWWYILSILINHQIQHHNDVNISDMVQWYGRISKLYLLFAVSLNPSYRLKYTPVSKNWVDVPLFDGKDRDRFYYTVQMDICATCPAHLILPDVTAPKFFRPRVQMVIEWRDWVISVLMWEFPCSVPQEGYSDVCHGFPQSLQAES